MYRNFPALLKKDFRLMLSGKFFLLAVGSLILYSSYINFVYVNLNQDIYPVYLYAPDEPYQDGAGPYQDGAGGYDDENQTGYKKEGNTNEEQAIIRVKSLDELKRKCEDGYSVGADVSGEKLRLYMVSSGSKSTDNHRAAYARSVLRTGNPADDGDKTQIIGIHDKEMKSRREITCEFLFFELAAVGFLGLASMLFKEKQMGVIRVHGILPVSRGLFIFSKIILVFLADMIFSSFMTLINLGIEYALEVLPGVLVQAGILSLLMSLTGVLCAVMVPDFRQFSLLYLVLAIFILIPVYLAGQTGITWGFMDYHPMYHLFMAMKDAYFGVQRVSVPYYIICLSVIMVLFLAVHRSLAGEMAKEG